MRGSRRLPGAPGSEQRGRRPARAPVAAGWIACAVLLLSRRDRGTRHRVAMMPAHGARRDAHGHAQASLCALIGSDRRRLPVAAKMALQSAGATGGTAVSPRPPGAAVLGMM